MQMRNWMSSHFGVDKCKITVIERASSHFKNYTRLFEFDLKIYISDESMSNP